MARMLALLLVLGAAMHGGYSFSNGPGVTQQGVCQTLNPSVAGGHPVSSVSGQGPFRILVSSSVYNTNSQLTGNLSFI